MCWLSQFRLLRVVVSVILLPEIRSDMVSTTIVLEVGCKYEPCHYFMLEESVALRDMRT